MGHTPMSRIQLSVCSSFYRYLPVYDKPTIKVKLFILIIDRNENKLLAANERTFVGGFTLESEQ